jgi:hypothetical protein
MSVVRLRPNHALASNPRCAFLLFHKVFGSPRRRARVVQFHTLGSFAHHEFNRGAETVSFATAFFAMREDLEQHCHAVN